MCDKSVICFIQHWNGARSPGRLLHFWPQVSEMFFLAAQSFQTGRYSYYSMISKMSLNNLSAMEHKPQLQTDHLSKWQSYPAPQYCEVLSILPIRIRLILSAWLAEGQRIQSCVQSSSFLESSTYLWPLWCFPDRKAVPSFTALYCCWFVAKAIEVSRVNVGAILQLINTSHFPVLDAFLTSSRAGTPMARHPPGK